MWRDLLVGTVDDADIVVFGIPSDENCSVGRGAALACSVMRELSESLPPYAIDRSRIPPILFDMGDVSGYDYTAALKMMRGGLGKKLTVMLGGDHSVSILTEKAYRALNEGRRGLIHIDAHADICDFYNGSKTSHACVNMRALENGFSKEDITMIGIRSYEGQEVDFLEKNEVCIYSSDDVIANADSVIDAIVAKYSDYDGVYISFDIDSVDPAYAPGTGTPEAFGMPSSTVLYVLKRLFAALPIDAMDIVEVAPPLDVNNVTSWLALKYLLEIINLVNKKAKGAQ